MSRPKYGPMELSKHSYCQQQIYISCVSLVKIFACGSHLGFHRCLWVKKNYIQPFLCSLWPWEVKNYNFPKKSSWVLHELLYNNIHCLQPYSIQGRSQKIMFTEANYDHELILRQKFVTEPAIIGHVGNKIWPLFQSFFSCNFLFHYCMAIKYSEFAQNLFSFVIQVSEWKYSILETRYNSLSNVIYSVPICPVFTGPVTFCNIKQN